MVTQDCNSPIMTTISSMASCMAIFIAYGTASMAHKIPWNCAPAWRFWALYTHTMITNNLSGSDSNIICIPPVYEYTADLNESSQPASFHRVWTLIISISSFFICQLHHNTPLQIILKCFFKLERAMIKAIDVVSTIQTPLTLQEKKKVAVASCHTSLQIPVRIYTTDSVLSLIGKSSCFWKSLVPFKLLVYVQRYVQHMKHVKYPITRSEGFSELCLSFVDWVCPIGSSDSITG